MVPVSTLARAMEILEALLAKACGLCLYTPITGTILILNDLVPFILINGSPYIPWFWANFLIPLNSEDTPTDQRLIPTRVYNWMGQHFLVTCTLNDYFDTDNLVIPLELILDRLNISAQWGSLRNHKTKEALRSKLLPPMNWSLTDIPKHNTTT